MVAKVKQAETDDKLLDTSTAPVSVTHELDKANKQHKAEDSKLRKANQRIDRLQGDIETLKADVAQAQQDTGLATRVRDATQLRSSEKSVQLLTSESLRMRTEGSPEEANTNLREVQ